MFTLIFTLTVLGAPGSREVDATDLSKSLLLYKDSSFERAAIERIMICGPFSIIPMFSRSFSVKYFKDSSLNLWSEKIE